MPITEEQRIARRNGIGSSDLAAIMGLSPWRTPYDVYLDKTGVLEDQESNPAMEAGNRFEDGVLDYAEDILGELKRNQTKPVSGTPIVVNTDAVVCNGLVPVEAKTVGLFHHTSEFWGDEGTDQVPDRVIIQSHAHMMAWDKDICHVPAFIGGTGFKMFAVRRDHRIVKAIIEDSLKFWECVTGLTPPEGSTATLQVVKRVRRKPEHVANVDPELVSKWLEAKEAEKEAEAQAKEAQAALLTALGEAEAGMCGELGAVTYLQQTRRGIDTAALKADHPEIYHKYYREGEPFRVLRHKKKGL